MKHLRSLLVLVSAALFAAGTVFAESKAPSPCVSECTCTGCSCCKPEKSKGKSEEKKAEKEGKK